jgi:hypothetical protein
VITVRAELEIDPRMGIIDYWYFQLIVFPQIVKVGEILRELEGRGFLHPKEDEPKGKKDTFYTNTAQMWYFFFFEGLGR